MSKFFFALLLVLGCKSQASTFSNKTSLEADNMGIRLQIDSIRKIAAEGNIIFRGGTDIESNIIRDFSYKDKLFSHCGLLLKEGNELKVTHILGGITNPAGGIITQPIEDFLAYPDNESAGIYETSLSRNELIKIYSFIDSLKKINVTFDLKFDLFTKQQLYCTEIVIDALSYAKKDKKIFPPTTFNLKNTKYFFLKNSGDDFLFYPIDLFQHHTSLTVKSIFYFPNYKKM